MHKKISLHTGRLPLRSFRLVCKKEETPLLESLLGAQGFVFKTEPFLSFARRLVHEPIPLGASLAAFFGYIYIQDRSSMLPPLALQPPIGAPVLDMCASPGSKTGLLAQLVGEQGFVLANEPNPQRLLTLRRNLEALNLFSCAAMGHNGEALPLPSATASCEQNIEPRGWPAILLDPPCSGWGTVEKHPGITRLWKPEKVQPLIALQRQLLREAARLLAPGGRLVYSTCTTNVAENEDQVCFARDFAGLCPVPLAPVPGFDFAGSERAGVDGCLRVATGEQGQGFFVALLEKPGTLPAPPPKGLPPGKGTVLPRAHIASDWCLPDLLPPGEVAVFGETLHFLPEQALAYLPAGVNWKGFALGRAFTSKGLRVSPFLHRLMPSLDQAQKNSLPHINLEDTAPLLQLLTGTSLPVQTKAKVMGLYYKGLPLCCLSVKGTRAMLPPRQ